MALASPSEGEIATPSADADARARDNRSTRARARLSGCLGSRGGAGVGVAEARAQARHQRGDLLGLDVAQLAEELCGRRVAVLLGLELEHAIAGAELQVER